MAASTSAPSPPQASKYLTPKPTVIAQGQVSIDHPQLRDLLVCRDERGVVSYLRDTEIVEQNLLVAGAPVRTVAQLSFTPSSLTAISLGPNDEDTLFAAGGSWNADIHLSYHRGRPNTSTGSTAVWQRDTKLRGTLNNSVLLTRNHSSGVEPRVGVTNNDRTFRMYDCAVRNGGRSGVENNDEESDEDDEGNQVLECVGALALDTCVNYASISPTGRTLLCVGDSPNLYIHNISGSSQLSFHPIIVLPIPLPTNTPPHYPAWRPSTFTASFATAFSANSLQFAVGSQEGVAAIWDIRNASRPMKVWQTDKMRAMGLNGMGAASGWISWDPSDWSHSRAPAWSVRNIKFVGGNRPDGKESLVFTEHTSLMHIVDAKTLEDEEIIRIPSRMADPQPPTPPMYASGPLDSPLSYIQLGLPASAFSAGPANPSGWVSAGAQQPPSPEYEEDDEDQWMTDDEEEELACGHDIDRGEDDDIDVDAGSLFAASLLLDLASSGSGSSPQAGGSGSSSVGLISAAARSRRRRRRDADAMHVEEYPPGYQSWLQQQFTTTLPFALAPSSSTSGHHQPLPHRLRNEVATSPRLPKKPVHSHSNPQYLISDGYAFPAETAELDYRRNDDDDEGDDNNTAQGLDIAGLCGDPSGKWLYVASTRGVVEWGLI